ncbi:unnamed protein product [Hymenolepis diminuta]|uniref:Uncharacterized protein n=1 Tax=Hymenolepis diminuta TaxID=6216 RepID=A0A564Z2N7_HYMDI|nr:unnamed protein product [Hymenolepis diminuta]
MIIRVNILFIAFGWLLIFKYPWVSLLFCLTFMMEFLKRVATEQASLENPNINLHIEEVKKGSRRYTLPDLIGHPREIQENGETVTAAVTDNDRSGSQHTADDENKPNSGESVPEVIESNIVNPIAVK